VGGLFPTSFVLPGDARREHSWATVKMLWRVLCWTRVGLNPHHITSHHITSHHITSHRKSTCDYRLNECEKKSRRDVHSTFHALPPAVRTRSMHAFYFPSCRDSVRGSADTRRRRSTRYGRGRDAFNENGQRIPATRKRKRKTTGGTHRKDQTLRGYDIAQRNEGLETELRRAKAAGISKNAARSP